MCDYSIRLNWEGRGKKKPENPGEMAFSMLSTTIATGGQIAGTNSVVQDLQLDAGLATRTNLEALETGTSHEQQPLLQFGRAPGNSSGATTLPPTFLEESSIDPALMNESSSSFRSDPTYTQIYERPRSLLANGFEQRLVGSAQRSHPVEIVNSSLSPSEYINSPSASTVSTGSGMQIAESAISTPSSLTNGKDDYQRPLKRLRTNDYGIKPPPIASPTTLSSVNPSLVPHGIHIDLGSRENFVPEVIQPAEMRRMSVSSLLSGPVGISSSSHTTRPSVQDWSLQSVDAYQDARLYGIDRGLKDLDIGQNDDLRAISGSPTVARGHFDFGAEEALFPAEFGFGMETNPAFQNGASYYDKPVQILIPRALEPLPPKLLENPMNLLYFHHFLNHTAGCLIPHNCSSNPFKSTLPQMAVRDDNLLNLLLAYSASHRARHLRQAEPAIRIAQWVQNIFPDLRKALDNPTAIISNANLATAIMLASLEIISPKAFGVEVPWQNHLDTARQMITARGGPQRMQTASRGDQVSTFLWSWFAYLDVLGSLSGGKANSSSSAWVLDYEIDAENDYSIDCILGFTSRCVHILAKIAELARISDNSRIGSDHSIRPEWQPSEDVIARAALLEADLAASRLHPAKPCNHMQSSGEAAYQWDRYEMAATNEAFHWAGLVHLQRRILGKPSTHPDVQNAVREIFGALYKVRRGSSAEACLLFPMFTAGCDIGDHRQREEILARVKSVERLGMTQVKKARALMERVWETGKPWETLVAGEFFG